MKNADFDHLNCSLAQTVSVVGEHWTLLVIRDVFMGLHRFSDIQNDLGIARNILSARLKRLVAEGILVKVPAASGFYEYRLTEKGLALQPILLAMTHWGDKYRPCEAGRRLVFVDRRDGRAIQTMAVRAHDDRKLKPWDIRPKQGPGFHAMGRSTPLGGQLSAEST